MEKQQRPRKTVDPTTIMGFVALIGFLIMLWMLITPGGDGEYNDYEGPILPLSSLSGAGELTAVRHVQLDFADCAVLSESIFDPNTVLVTDRYELTNPTDHTVTARLVWGFEGRFTDPLERIPAITVDGAPADAVLYPSVDPDSTVRLALDFEGYKQALTQNDYLSVALGETPEWDAPVKVYHIYNVSYAGDEPVAPFLDVGFDYGESTNLWTPIYRTCEYDQKEKRRHLLFAPDQDAWLFVMGDDLVDVTVGGTKMHTQGIYTDTAVEGLSYELETYESTFMECIRQSAQDYRYPYQEDSPAVNWVTPELLVDGVMKRIDGTEYQEPDTNIRLLDTLFHEVVNEVRMLYWVFPVEIPAGETVTVTGVYAQETSRDGGVLPNRLGFDLATTLGSNLNFTGQTASAVNLEPISIVDSGKAQNFGFDHWNGITQVTLDLGTERYFMDFLVDIADE